LKDAELDIETLSRTELFEQRRANPIAGACEQGLGNPLLGLCHSASPDAAPAWQRIDAADDETAVSVPYGFFTGRGFPSAGNGASVNSPRYIIEVLAPPEQSQEGAGGHVGRMYRVTAIGYGSKQSVHAVLQIYYRKSSPEVAGLRTGRLSWREILNWEELRSALE
jgi:type IV pilus assembly protein PilX